MSEEKVYKRLTRLDVLNIIATGILDIWPKQDEQFIEDEAERLVRVIEIRGYSYETGLLAFVLGTRFMKKLGEK